MTATKEKAARGQTPPLFKSHDLLSWEEAAAYLGPTYTVKWMKRQVYEFKTIKAIRTGGRRVIARAELDRYVAECVAQAEGR
jgi:hypothetical protein